MGGFAERQRFVLVKDPVFARFYLLPKIQKRLHDVPGRPVISNSGYYTENMSSFLENISSSLATASSESQIVH